MDPIDVVGNHAHSGAKDKNGKYEPGENLAYGCFAPFDKRDDDPSSRQMGFRYGISLLGKPASI